MLNQFVRNVVMLACWQGLLSFRIKEFTIIKRRSHINSPDRHGQCCVCATGHSMQAHCGNSSSIYQQPGNSKPREQKGVYPGFLERLLLHISIPSLKRKKCSKDFGILVNKTSISKLQEL